MLTASLINNNIPRLQLQDSVLKAIQLSNDFRVSHLPVVSDDKYLGHISEEDLLDEDEKYTIEVLERNFVRIAVREDVHFLEAVSTSIQFDTNVVAVTDKDNNFLGVITNRDLLKKMGSFAGANEIGGIIILEMERPQFAISEISRIVESNDCHIMHLNTTLDSATGLLTVTIHLNRREIAAVVSSFERYEYNVIHFFGTHNFENEIKSNYENLMHYLDI